MDVYTDPRSTTYVTGTEFFMPTKHGEIHSIAVPRQRGNHIVALYSVLLIFLFNALWKLLVSLVLAFFPSLENPNLQVLLVGFLNSGDPITALAFTSGYTFKAWTRKDWPTFRWSFLPLFVAACVSLGGIFASIFVPGAMAVGTVAPARASEVFFAPTPPEMTSGEGLKIQALRAPAAVRAIGSVEASKVTLRSRVAIGRDLPSVGDAPTLRFPYEYTVFGWDFGLQRYPEFKQIVKGECVTEYKWLAKGTGEVDRYQLWGFQNQTVDVQRVADGRDPPYAEVRMHPNRLYDAANGGKFYFAIIPNTAGRHSFTTSVDPWYRTVSPVNTNATSRSQNDASYVVDSGRPALSCWQETSYAYKGDKVNSVYDLGKLRGFKIPTAWHNHFRNEFSGPKMVDLGISLGRGILLSSTTYLEGNFDAGSSTTRNDLERLVLGAFVASRDIFRDSTMVNGGENAALTPQGRPESGVADFILATGAVVTLRLGILASVPVLTFVLYVVIAAVAVISKWHAATGKGIWSRYCARSTAFQATQLYRLMDEEAPKGTAGSSTRLDEEPNVMQYLAQCTNHEAQKLYKYMSDNPPNGTDEGRNVWGGFRSWVPSVNGTPSSCLEPELKLDATNSLRSALMRTPARSKEDGNTERKSG